MAVDSTFEFEKRRNRPVKYDREMVAKTLSAMERVQEIKETREKRFYANRMKDRETIVKGQKRAELEKGMQLIVPHVADKDKVMKKVVEKVKDKVEKRRQQKEMVKAAGKKKKKGAGGNVTGMDVES